MKLRISALVAIATFVIAVNSAQSFAQNAYVPNFLDDNVSVIDTATDGVTATIHIPSPNGNDGPYGVAVSRDGSRVYVTDEGPGNVSVINTAANSVTATIPVGLLPTGVAVSPVDGNVYVANEFSSTVSVIDPTTNTVSATIPVSNFPIGVAVSPDGSKLYVTQATTITIGEFGGILTVVDLATNTVTNVVSIPGAIARGVAVSPNGAWVYVAAAGARATQGALWVVNTRFNTLFTTIPVGLFPFGVAVTPDGSRVYVTNQDANTVSVIDPGREIVTATIGVGSGPVGVDVTPDGKKVYVGNGNSNGTFGVSVIDAATNTVVDTITTGQQPVAFGKFIQPRFAGTPGYSNCHGKSVSALADQFKGLNAAAAALGFASVGALQNAIQAFCRG